MRKVIGLVLRGFIVFISSNVWAQSYADEALLFGRTSPGGSARIQGMGDAQVALGGDYSSAYSNPAGLGFFNRSEATLSLGTNFYNSTSSYLNNPTTDSKSNFNVPGFSLVLHTDKNRGKLLSGNFAISFTRTNNFNQNFTYQATNTQTSMIDSFIAQSDNYYDPQSNTYGAAPSKLFDPNNPNSNYYTIPWLGYKNYLFGPLSEIVPNGDSTQYHTYATQIPFQHERVQISGAQNQVNLAYGVNFNDFFYLGGGIGIASLNYQSKKVYRETFSSGPLFGFELDENWHVTGTGVNATIGGIIKPKDFVQFGLSISTPTYYPTVSDDYNATLSSGWNNYNYVDVTHPSNNTILNGLRDSIYYQTPLLYALSTPWRLKAGATFFIQKHGLITAEIEKVNYSNAHFTSNSNTPTDFSADNKQIKTLLRNVFNLRLGGEYRFGSFRARLGYSYMPDPYTRIQNNVNNTRTSYSAGIGYRKTKFFVDLGFVQTQWNSSYIPYSISSIVTIKNTNSSAMITVGYNL